MNVRSVNTTGAGALVQTTSGSAIGGHVRDAILGRGVTGEERAQARSTLGTLTRVQAAGDAQAGAAHVDHMKGRIQADLDRLGLGGTINGIDYDRETNSYTLRMKPEDITQGHRDVQREWNSTVGNRDTYHGGWDPSWPEPPRINLPFYGM